MSPRQLGTCLAKVRMSNQAHVLPGAAIKMSRGDMVNRKPFSVQEAVYRYGYTDQAHTQ